MNSEDVKALVEEAEKWLTCYSDAGTPPISRMVDKFVAALLELDEERDKINTLLVHEIKSRKMADQFLRESVKGRGVERERAEKAEEANNILREGYDRTLKERDRLREALEFYAKSDNYKTDPETMNMSCIWNDEGELARQALKPEEETK